MSARRRARKLPPVASLAAEDHAQSTWALGHSFERAASQLFKAEKPQSTLVTSYLLLHALELFLKAYLVNHGWPEAHLRDLGHDLTASIRACRKANLGATLTLSGEAVRQVIRVNRYYRDKELEYFKPRPKRFGSVRTLHATVQTVASAVLEHIMEAGFARLYRAAT